MDNLKLISKAGLEKLNAEAMDIERQIVDTTKEMGESVKRDNDLRENPEYMELHTKAMHILPNQLNELREYIATAIIIEDTDEYINRDGSKVIIGSKVTFEVNGRKQTMSILGSKEGDFEHKILACDSPIAEAMLGKKVGDSFEFNGRTGIVKEIII